MKITTRQLVESAVMIAIGTILSMITIASPWKLGGGITVCSMLPLVILAFRHGTKVGVFASSVYGLIQMIIGFSNVQYATNFLMAMGIVLFDYIVAFGVVGFSAVFKKAFDQRCAFVFLQPSDTGRIHSQRSILRDSIYTSGTAHP